MSRIVVVGLGKLGLSVAEALTEGRADVVAVDVSLDQVEQARDRVAVTVQADATDPESLRAAGVEGASIAVMTIGDDLKSAVLAVAVLRELGVPRIVARANNAREERILRLVGAHETLLIEQEVGQRLAGRLLAR